MLPLLLLNMHSVRPVSLKLMLVAFAIIAAFASADLIGDQIGLMLPDASAAVPEIPANPEQQSWSDEWFKVQMAIPVSAEDIPTF